jgi:hypothetical protein
MDSLHQVALNAAIVGIGSLPENSGHSNNARLAAITISYVVLGSRPQPGRPIRGQLTPRELESRTWGSPRPVLLGVILYPLITPACSPAIQKNALDRCQEFGAERAVDDASEPSYR